MLLEGNIAVFIRLDGESPVTVFQDDDTQVSNVRVLAVGINTDITEVVGANLTEDHVFDGIVAFNDNAEALATELGSLAAHIKSGGDLQLYVADLTEENKSYFETVIATAGFTGATIDPEVNEYPGLANATLFTCKKLQA